MTTCYGRASWMGRKASRIGEADCREATQCWTRSARREWCNMIDRFDKWLFGAVDLDDMSNREVIARFLAVVMFSPLLLMLKWIK
jgi:hypothetical protein